MNFTLISKHVLDPPDGGDETVFEMLDMNCTVILLLCFVAHRWHGL